MAKAVCCNCDIRKVLRAFSIVDIILSIFGICCFITLQVPNYHYVFTTMEDRKKIVPKYIGRSGNDTDIYEEDITDVCFDYIQTYSSESLMQAFHAAVSGLWISLLGYLVLGFHLLFISLKPKKTHNLVNIILQIFATIVLITSCIFFNLPMLCQLGHYRGLNKDYPIDLQACVNLLTGIILLTYKIPEFINIVSLFKHLKKGTLNHGRRRTIGALRLYNYDVETSNRESENEEEHEDYNKQQKSKRVSYQERQHQRQTEISKVHTIHLEQQQRRLPRRIDLLDVY